MELFVRSFYTRTLLVWLCETQRSLEIPFSKKNLCTEAFARILQSRFFIAMAGVGGQLSEVFRAIYLEISHSSFPILQYVNSLLQYVNSVITDGNSFKRDN